MGVSIEGVASCAVGHRNYHKVTGGGPGALSLRKFQLSVTSSNTRLWILRPIFKSFC